MGVRRATPTAPVHLAAYIREAVRDVRTQRVDKLLAGELRLPRPETAVLVEDKNRSSED